MTIRDIEVKLTKLDCENLCWSWKRGDRDAVADVILTLTPLEALKFARQCICFHDETGGMINEITNYILNRQI
jgi:hypothetical protein